MKTINLFIACSTTSETLNEQKEKIVKLCKKLSVEFAEKGEQVNINSVAYDDLERRMIVFDNYIKRKADIVIFLVDKNLGTFLEEELRLSVKRGRIYRKPELLVYVSDNIENDAKQKIEEVLEKGGWLYDIPNNTDDLLADVEKRIKGYVGSYESIRKKQFMFKFWSWIGILGLLGCAFLGWKSYNQGLALRKAESKKLLIFGGGSARNYIEKKYLNEGLISGDSAKVKLNKVNPELWWYAPMPSGDAYRMIAEDIINLEGDYKKSLYYPIIISASKADKNSHFRRSLSVSKFREEGVVIGVHLGNDTLVVYGSNSMFDSHDINAFALDSLILDPSISIMKTSDNSGTFNAYYNDSTCPNLKNFVNKPDLIFSDKGIIDKEKWIALGSAYYWPANGKLNPYYVYIVKEGQKKYLFKSIYLYFVLYKDKNSGNYMLPTATLEFLDRIHVSEKIVDGNNYHLIIKNKKGEQINPDIVSSIEADTTTILFDKFYIEQNNE